MTIKSLQSTSLTNNVFYRSMLAGNDAYFPEFESDDFLEEVVLTSSASSVTFTGLASYATAGYKHLQIRYAVDTASTEWLEMRINGSSSNSDYAYHLLRGYGGSVTSQSGVGSVNKMSLNFNNSGSGSAGVTDLLDFASSSKNTTIRNLGGSTGSASMVVLASGVYLQQTAVTSVTILCSEGTVNLLSGSRISLYGSKG
jgi:hypothetical protein